MPETPCSVADRELVVGTDGWVYSLSGEDRSEHGVVTELLDEIGGAAGTAKDKIREWPSEGKSRLVGVLIQRLSWIDSLRLGTVLPVPPHAELRQLTAMRAALMEELLYAWQDRVEVPLTAIGCLLGWAFVNEREWTDGFPLQEILRIAERSLPRRRFPECEKATIRSLLAAVTQRGVTCDGTIIAALHAASQFPFEPGEAWSDAAFEQLETLQAAERGAWAVLLAHAKTATGSKPSAKWVKTAVALRKRVGADAFRAAIARWFPLTQTRRTIRALNDRECRARCAARVYSQAVDRLQTAFATTHGAGNHFWPVYRGIERELWKSEDPWHFLRTSPIQEVVRNYFASGAPTFDLPPEPPDYDPPEDHLLSDTSMDILRGLAWMCGLQEDRELARALVTLALSAYRKIPGIGPRATRVGNACITALGMMQGLDAVGQLALLKVKVKFGTAQIAIEKALTAAAAREGLPREELEEMSVPAYGLTEVGRLVETLGEFTAELKVAGTKSVEIIWRRADGKVQKSLPAAVKKEFAEELKELNAAKKDIEKMLPAQAERIDSLFLQQKTWPLETWLERYLEHPLVGTLARRLIWNFTTDGTTTPGLWLDGKLVDRLGHAVPLDAARTAVALWHPLDQAPDVVLGWRAFLEEWQIVQPFKQAHREVYVLTPAEERTGTYSNRFAAHILKQHQFHALCAARGWKNALHVVYEDRSWAASKALPNWDLRVRFVTSGMGDEVNDNGVFLYVATDQVQFVRDLPPTAGEDDLPCPYPPDFSRLDDGVATFDNVAFAAARRAWEEAVYGRSEPLPLTEIPPLVFSEMMRDVDLFVGVASVGNDPAWADGGRGDAERDAWSRFSFGDLSATAQTRRDLLQRLVPKLKIADRCSFADKFLVVRGDLRTYKIHLGSGNILMSPNDQHLCIVPGAGKAEDGKVFLPFEGDRTLSVILSKAFLLAADSKITDPSVTRQIGR
jgi:hypothetical protein